MSKMQQTLAAFGLTKTINHRGTEVKVNIPSLVSDSPLMLKCPTCVKSFVNKPGLSVHMKCVHLSINSKKDNFASFPKIEGGGSKEIEIADTPGPSIYEGSNSAEKEEMIPLPHFMLTHQSKKIELRRGIEKRQSWTNGFKSKIIAEIENGEKSCIFKSVRGQIKRFAFTG